MEWYNTIIAIIGSLGGVELFRWLLTRRATKRQAEATATTAEIQSEEAEFLYLRKRIEFNEQQLVEKEKRFAEQTAVLRQVQADLHKMTIENGKLSADIAALKAERAMKLCERKGCAQRQPKSGY